MGRIKNLEQYRLKTIPTEGDYVIGASSDDNGETVNFPVTAFSGSGVDLQNNRFKLIKTGTASNSTEVVSVINSATTLTEVLSDEIPIFVTIKPPTTAGEPTLVQYWGLIGIGKGIYGAGGNITVATSNLFVLEEFAFTLGTGVDDILNSFVIDFGAVADSSISTFVDEINNSLDTYVIQAGTNWYFQGTVGGNLVIYGWKGANGTYGNGGTTVVSADLFLLEDNTGTIPQPSTLPTGLEKIDEGNGQAWRLIGRDSSLYNNAGLDSVDFSTSTGGFGATGQQSFNVGGDNRASGFGAVTMGSSLTASGTLSTVLLN